MLLLVRKLMISLPCRSGRIVFSLRTEHLEMARIGEERMRHLCVEAGVHSASHLHVRCVLE
jgi:hypothetical protein